MYPVVLEFHASNQLQQLSEQLIARLREDLRESLDLQYVLVPTVGIRDWLRQRIATSIGICAGIQFCYPGQLLDVIAEKLGLEITDQQWLQSLPWQCLRLLDRIPQLQVYLAHAEPYGRRAYNLASTLADCFDRYARYRPSETIIPWSMGKLGAYGHEAQWQAHLWQLLQQQGSPNPLEQFGAIVQALREQTPQLPTYFHVFGFNTISPRLLYLLDLLSNFCQVPIYSLQPTWGYWDDQQDRRSLLRQQGSPTSTTNPLLGDWGALGRTFLQQIDDAGAHYHARPEDFYTATPTTILQRLQSDILAGQGPQVESPFTIEKDDRSLSIHACHSLRRQIEVAKEWIHTSLAEDPDLQLHDIAIMSPQIDQVAPLTQAILASDSFGPSIPLVVADKSIHTQNDAAQIVLRLTQLIAGSFAASDIYEFLSSPIIAQAWGFDQQNLRRIRYWCQQAPIHWGVDENHRQETVGEAYAAHSWINGLQRLFLSWWYGNEATDQPYMLGNRDKPSETIVPAIELNGDDWRCLQQLLNCLQPLLDASAPARAGALADWWAETLSKLCAHCLCCDIDNPDLAHVHHHLGLWQEQLQAMNWDQPLPAETVHAHFDKVFALGPGGDFARGALTVCGMVPMRSVPFKVICLVGMDDGLFPRQGRSIDFDLIKAHPQSGDRDLRREDLYLFLELVVSVHQQLCITYQGFDPQHNAVYPPAAVVTELLEVIKATCANDEVTGRILHHHRLHRSLEASPWPSVAIRDEAQSLRSPRHSLAWITESVAIPQSRQFDLADLVSFWENPTAAFARHCGIAIARRNQDSPGNYELMGKPQALQKYQLHQRLLEVTTEQGVMLGEAYGLLPNDAFAWCAWQDLGAETVFFLDKAQGYLKQAQALSINCQWSQQKLVGIIPYFHPEQGSLIIRPGKVGAKHLLQACLHSWALHHSGNQATSFIIGVDGKTGKDRSIAYDPVYDHLLNWYQQGNSKLIPFAPETSYVYAQTMLDKNDHHAALEKARNQWDGGLSYADGTVRGEKDSAGGNWFWPHGIYQEPQFAETALEIWRPLLTAGVRL